MPARSLTRIPAGVPTGGRFTSRGRTDTDIALDDGEAYVLAVVTEIRSGIDVDTIAARDGWATSPLDRSDTERCAQCGHTIDLGTPTDAGLCLPCTDADWVRCGFCGELVEADMSHDGSCDACLDR